MQTSSCSCTARSITTPNTEDKNIAEVIVAKQRNGPLGTIKLAWLGQYTRFASLQQGEK